MLLVGLHIVLVLFKILNLKHKNFKLSGLAHGPIYCHSFIPTYEKNTKFHSNMKSLYKIICIQIRLIKFLGLNPIKSDN